MMTLTHQRLVKKLNLRAEAARENAGMVEIERHAAPLFYAVFGIAAAALLWTLTADYRDVWQQKIDTLADKRALEIVKNHLTQCAKGEIVRFGDGFMTCRVVNPVYVLKGKS